MQTQSKIEQQVMASVGIIYLGRSLMSATALKLYVFVAAAYTLVQLTWVHKVFANWAHVGLGGTWQFVTYAILHTHLPVQVALMVLAVAGILLVRDAVRAYSSLEEPLLPTFA